MGSFPKPGDKLKFMNRNGYDGERADAAKVFTVGEPLTVTDCDVGSWSHSVWFAEHPGRGWNGVMFEPVDGPERYPLPSSEPPILSAIRGGEETSNASPAATRDHSLPATSAEPSAAWRCTRCGRDEIDCRANGCGRGPCPMVPV